MNTTPSLYRPCVGMMLINNQKQVFVAQRSDFVSDAWQMPQGGIDDGETPFDAAMRELQEEIGTNHVELITESPHWHFYDLPPELQNKLWKGQYKGQKQKWFLFKFKGQDTDIDITETNEFIAWKWVEMTQLTALIVPFKLDVYQKIIAEFEGYILRQPSL